MGHHLIFSALWDRTWTRLPVNQSIGCGGPVNRLARSPDVNPLDFWLWGHLKTLVCSVPINDLGVLQQRVDNASQQIRMKAGIFWQSEHIRVSKYTGTTHSTCRRDHTNIAHISASTGFWTYVDWEFFAHLSEYYTFLKLWAFFYTLHTYFASEVWLLVKTQ
jgi:hypothetical protein